MLSSFPDPPPYNAFVLVPIPLPARTILPANARERRYRSSSRAPLKCCLSRPSVAFVLSNFEAIDLLALKKQAHQCPKLVSKPYSVDIGRRSLDHLLVCQNGISIPDSTSTADLTHATPVVVTWTELKKMSKKGKAGAFECYLDGETAPRRVASFSDTTNRAASLHPCKPGKPPTLILGGFGMHRLKDTDPQADTDAKIRAIGRQHLRGNVLDVCTGLGYTAIAAARVENVISVTTIELDPVVISMQKRNPWSQPLFSNEKVVRIEDDATVRLPTLPACYFDLVIHDPPAQAMAGELYSTSFYEHLRRVCKPEARLFHYIGDPSSHESGKLYRGVMRRLGDAGFCEIQTDAGAFGIVAQAG